MANINGIIQRDKPVDVAGDIYKVLGLAPRLIAGTNLVCYPISYAAGNAHGKINQWSKIKPVEIENGIATRISKDTLAYTASSIGVSGLLTGYTNGIPAYMGRVFSEQRTVGGVTFNLFHVFGMTVPWANTGVNPSDSSLATTMRTLTINANAQNVNWAYQPVSGGTKAPFRVLDFEGYCHTAACPIYYQAKNVYSGQRGRFSFFRTVEDFDTQINLSDLDKIFRDFHAYVAYFHKGSGSYIPNSLLDFGLLKNDYDSTVETTNTLSPSGSALQEDCEAFFFIGNKSKGIFCTLPSLPDSANPQTFSITTRNDPNSPVNQVDWTEWSFARDRTDPYFESFDNVGEGLYSLLFSGNGEMCVRVKIQNYSDSAQTFDRSYFRLTLGSRNLNIGVYTSAKDTDVTGSTQTQITANGKITIASKDTLFIFFQISGLFDGEGITKAPSANTAFNDRPKYCLTSDVELRYHSGHDGLFLPFEVFYADGTKRFYSQTYQTWYNQRSSLSFS